MGSQLEHDINIGTNESECWCVDRNGSLLLIPIIEVLTRPGIIGTHSLEPLGGCCQRPLKLSVNSLRIKKHLRPAPSTPSTRLGLEHQCQYEDK